MGRVFTQDTLNTTGYNKSELILVITKMVRTGLAKSVGEAIKMLDEGTVNKEELLELVIKSHQQELPKSETQEEVKVNVR